MSSDESDYDQDGHKIYVVHTLPWLAESINKAKEESDQYRLEAGLYQARGSFPRTRTRTGVMSSRPAAKGLPRSFYNPEWIKGQNTAYLRTLKIKEDSAPPPHTSSMHKKANKSSKSNKLNKSKT